MIVFMNIHPHIAGIAKTFRVVGFELINFLLSFGIIFVFLAFLAHIRSAPDANALSPSYLFCLPMPPCLALDFPVCCDSLLQTSISTGKAVFASLSSQQFCKH